MSIKNLRQEEQPREKLLNNGADTLTDVELLALVLRTGRPGQSVLELSRYMLNEFGSLSGLLSTSKNQLLRIPGIGPARYAELQAMLELGRRHLKEAVQRQGVVQNPQATRDYLTVWLRNRQQEVFACLFLDNQHRIITALEMFYGTIDCASVHPREIVRQALQHNAAAVILAHNHPSGVAEPSQADRQITDLIKNALRLIDVRVIDHIVIGGHQTISLAEMGWI